MAHNRFKQPEKVSNQARGAQLPENKLAPILKDFITIF
jgi:hypothetical protein